MEKVISVKNSVVFIIIVLHLFGCGNNQGQTSDSEKISYELVKLSKKDGNCNDQNTDYCAEITIEYPVFTIEENEDIQKKINRNISGYMFYSVVNDDIKNTFDELANEFFNDYREYKNEVPESYMAWYIERFGSVIFYNEDFISLRVTENSFLGGAHPNSYTSLTVLDLNNGNKTSLDDIFIEGYNRDLNKIAEQEFRKMKELKEYEDLEEAGFWFDDNKFNINNNFALSDEGLTFYYNNYEITAYAYGPTELIIPMAKISQLIKDGGILSEFMKQ